MTADALFPSRLGADFKRLDPLVQWVHDGAARDLKGTVSVERGSSLVATLLGALTSLPPNLKDAPIRVQIVAKDDKERWIRTYSGYHRMTSTLSTEGEYLTERLGPTSLTFRLATREAGMDWRLERVSMMGIPLPANLFQVSARVDVQDSRYHFLIDSALRGIGRIVRYGVAGC